MKGKQKEDECKGRKGAGRERLMGVGEIVQVKRNFWDTKNDHKM